MTKIVAMNSAQQQQVQLLINNGCLQEAKALCVSICDKQKSNADAWYTLGLINIQLAELDEAGHNFICALGLVPGSAEINYNIANVYKLQGHLDQAVSYYRKAIHLKPDFSEAYVNLGNALKSKGELDTAIEQYQKAIMIKPDDSKAYTSLAVALEEKGLVESAIETLQQAIRLTPNEAIYFHMLGDLLSKKGRHEAAVEKYQKTIQLKPDFAYAYHNLGTIYHKQGLMSAAIKSFRKALLLMDDSAVTHKSLGASLQQHNEYTVAVDHYKKALALRPDYAEAHSDLGMALKNLGQYEVALEHFRKALCLKPDYTEAHSNLLFVLGYNVLRSPQEMLEESQHWDHIQGRDGKAHRFTHPTSGDPNKYPLGHKCLRIGYVSPDLRHHPVSYFLEPILAEHDRTQVEVFCYAEVNQPDAVTQRLKARADHWRSTVGMTDQALAQLIFDDHIDILIDLAGHTAHNRLKAFTYKPAPVQATYLGYFATTGLTTMDYWITDETLHPNNSVELATESLFRLPRCCLVYQAAPEAPEVIERSGEDIVFGSFNQLTKTSPATIALWAKVLQAVPQARLLIKTKQLADPAMSTALRSRFAEHSIDSERLTLLPYVPSEQAHLETYGRVDIALDTIPRTGGSTTTEALWMGVPVITLAGERFIERLSASMLNAIGLDELIAESQEDYVTKAVALANDRHRLHQIRASLRERMAASPLCDARGLAQTLESAYREMWVQYSSTPT